MHVLHILLSSLPALFFTAGKGLEVEVAETRGVWEMAVSRLRTAHVKSACWSFHQRGLRWQKPVCLDHGILSGPRRELALTEHSVNTC